MKNATIAFIALFALIVGLGIHIVKNHQFKQREQTKKVAIAHDNQPVRILTPNPKTLVLGSSTSATLRTYTSPDDGYSIAYPLNWAPSINSQLKNFTGDVMVFTTGPVGSNALGYPSFLQIAVDENPHNMTLDSFITKHYGSVHLTTVTIGGFQGEQTSDVQAPTANTLMIIKPKQKIYQIRFFDGAEPKITKEALSNVLNSFKIKETAQ